MEEVKNQIGEALPGALSLFVDAASEFSGKQLTTPEFFKMMENGELLAKDILPLMGKRMSIAANKGGALEKSLAGNQTAMNRLTTEWKFFQEIIFNSGFGEALTRTFNSLAFALKNNDGAAKAIGITLGGLIDGFMYFGGTVHDVSLLTYHYLNKYIIDPLTQLVPALKEIEGSWVAQAAGVLIAASAFSKLAGFLGSVLAALTGIKKLLPTVTKAMELLDKNPTLTKNPAPLATASGTGLGAILAGLLTPVYGMFASKDFPLFPLQASSEREKEYGLASGSLSWNPGLRDVLAEWGISKPSIANPNYYQMNAPRAAMGSNMMSPLMNQQPQNITVKVVPDGTKFADAVKVEVDAGTSNFGNTLINLMSD